MRRVLEEDIIYREMQIDELTNFEEVKINLFRAQVYRKLNGGIEKYYLVGTLYNQRAIIPIRYEHIEWFRLEPNLREFYMQKHFARGSFICSYSYDKKLPPRLSDTIETRQKDMIIEYPPRGVCSSRGIIFTVNINGLDVEIDNQEYIYCIKKWISKEPLLYTEYVDIIRNKVVSIDLRGVD